MKVTFIKNIQTAIAVTAVILLTACGGKQETESSADSEVAAPETQNDTTGGEKHITFTADQYKLAGIETGQIARRNLSNIIKLNGMVDVEPSGTASVSAPLGGYVRTAGLLPGEPIRKGQVLAILENPEFINLQQDYLESSSRFKYLEQELTRQRKLREEDVNAAKTLQEIESDYKVMEARISGLEQRLALAGITKETLASGKIVRTGNVYAPIAGYIKTSNVNIGKYVNPTDVLFEIVNKNELHLALNAFEKDLGAIRVGQTVKYSLANDNRYNRTAKVFLVGQAAGNDRVIPVHCHLDQKNNPDIVPGLYVKAWIETGTAEQPAVPTEALVQLEGKDYLILQTGSDSKNFSFSLVQVRKGIEQEGYTAVTLPEGRDAAQQTIVMKNAYAILSAIKNAEEEE